MDFPDSLFFVLLIGCVVLYCIVLYLWRLMWMRGWLVLALARLGLTAGIPALSSWWQENLAWSFPSGMDFSYAFCFCTVGEQPVDFTGVQFAGHCNQVDVISVLEWTQVSHLGILWLYARFRDGSPGFSWFGVCWSWRPGWMCLCAFEQPISEITSRSQRSCSLILLSTSKS